MSKDQNKIRQNPCLIYHSSSKFSLQHYYLYKYKYRRTLQLSHQDLIVLRKYRARDLALTKSIKIGKDNYHADTIYLRNMMRKQKTIRQLAIPDLTASSHKIITSSLLNWKIEALDVEIEHPCSIHLITLVKYKEISLKLQKLALTFIDHSGEQFVSHISTQYLNNIKSLSLKFSSDDIVNKKFVALFSTLNLSNLCFHFGTSHYYLGEKLRLIGQIIDTQLGLKKFELMFFGASSVIEGDLGPFYQSLVSLKQLNDLRFKLNCSPSIELRSLLESLTLLNLHSLTLIFEDISTNDMSSFENLAKSLRLLTKLSISIENGSRIHNDSLNFLARPKSFPALKNFRLSIKTTKLSVIAFQHFKEFFVSHPDLQEFNLSISNDNNISDDILEELGIGLGYCSTIQIFEVEFISCPALSDDVFFTLANTVSMLEDIRKLKLVFPTKSPINQKPFKEFLEVLEEKQSLNSLCLEFPFLKFEREEILLDIPKRLKRLSQLETLELGFRENSFQSEIIIKLLRTLRTILNCKVNIFYYLHSPNILEENKYFRGFGNSKLNKLAIETYHG